MALIVTRGSVKFFVVYFLFRDCVNEIVVYVLFLEFLDIVGGDVL